MGWWPEVTSDVAAARSAPPVICRPQAASYSASLKVLPEEAAAITITGQAMPLTTEWPG